MAGSVERAIQKDCVNLIDQFVTRKNPKFECFAQQWKSSMFHRIYVGQSLTTEIIQSTNVCIHFAKRVFIRKPVLPKIGALYLLYAIYFKQPTERFLKIDVDQKTWISLKEFIKELETLPFTEEARCVFWQLVKQDAFKFVASDTYYGLENLVNLDKIGSNSFVLSSAMHHFRNETRNLTRPWGLLTGIEKLHEGYEEMKEILNKLPEPGKPHNVVPMMTSFAELKDAFNAVNSMLMESYAQTEREQKKVRRKANGTKKGEMRRKKTTD